MTRNQIKKMIHDVEFFTGLKFVNQYKCHEGSSEIIEFGNDYIELNICKWHDSKGWVANLDIQTSIFSKFSTRLNISTMSDTDFDKYIDHVALVKNWTREVKRIMQPICSHYKIKELWLC